MMRALLICAAAAAPLFYAAPAFAFCSKPILPFCANDGELADNYVTEARCRRVLADHLTDLADYRSCLGSEIEQIDKTMARVRKMLGEDAEPPGDQQSRAARPLPPHLNPAPVNQPGLPGRARPASAL